MEAEGIDVAVMFPSRGLSVLTRPDIDPGLGAAIARAYNDWMYDFCSVDPNRMFGAGMISVYDINDAVAETRRAVQELGFKAVFVRSNVVNGRNWHDTWYDPLWETLAGTGHPHRLPRGLRLHVQAGRRALRQLHAAPRLRPSRSSR